MCLRPSAVFEKGGSRPRPPWILLDTASALARAPTASCGATTPLKKASPGCARPPPVGRRSALESEAARSRLVRCAAAFPVGLSIAKRPGRPSREEPNETSLPNPPPPRDRSPKAERGLKNRFPKPSASRSLRTIPGDTSPSRQMRPCKKPDRLCGRA